MNWIFWLAGLVVLGYSLYLIHGQVQVSVAHAILLISAVLIFLFPNLNVKIGADGSIEVKLDTLNIATQGTLEAVDALQKRLDNIAQATETRLSEIERASSSPAKPDVKSELPNIANPPGVFVPAIDNNQAWRDILKDNDGWLTGPMALPLDRTTGEVTPTSRP